MFAAVTGAKPMSSPGADEVPARLGEEKCLTRRLASPRARRSYGMRVEPGSWRRSSASAELAAERADAVVEVISGRRRVHRARPSASAHPRRTSAPGDVADRVVITDEPESMAGPGVRRSASSSCRDSCVVAGDQRPDTAVHALDGPKCCCASCRRRPRGNSDPRPHGRTAAGVERAGSGRSCSASPSTRSAATAPTRSRSADACSPRSRTSLETSAASRRTGVRETSGATPGPNAQVIAPEDSPERGRWPRSGDRTGLGLGQRCSLVPARPPRAPARKPSSYAGSSHITVHTRDLSIQGLTLTQRQARH